MSETAREIIMREMTNDTNDMRVAGIIRGIVAKMAGKIVSRRIVSAVENAAPSWTVYYRREYGMTHLDVWGGDTGRPTYDKRASFLLCYDSEPTLSVAEFDRCNTWAGDAGAGERNRQRAKLLASDYPEQVDAAAAALIAAYEHLEKLTGYPVPDSSYLCGMARHIEPRRNY